MTDVEITAAGQSRRALLLPALGAGLIATSLYLATLMLTVSGCESDYCADVGEFQVALATWGTVHHTGYPLYMLLGSPFVTALRWLGVPPSAGASLYSLVWEVLAVTGVALIVGRLTGKPWLAFGASLLLAATRSIWVHGALAEVYSLSMAITAAMLWVTFDLREQWSDGKGWLLAFLGGLGVAHHRLIALLLPAVGLWLLPSAWRSKNFWRWLALSIPFFLAGFLPYLDLPLRVWRGAKWVYGRPDTWDGFWFIFRGMEFAGLQRPNFGPTAMVTAAHDVLDVLASEFTWPGLAVIAIGLGVAIGTRPLRSTAFPLCGALLCYLLFSTFFRWAVLLEADLMTTLVILVILLALSLSRLSNRWQIPAGLALCGWAVFLGVRNYPFVVRLTRNPGSVTYIQRVEKLEAPPGAVVMAPWGGSYFALSYAHLVAGQMPQWNVVDHRANFAELAQATTGRIYTASDTLFVFDPAWWVSRLGHPLRITSASPGLIALSAQPLEAAPSAIIPIGDGLALVGWEVRPPDTHDQTDIVLYWTATRPPSADYSTFVHVTDQETITTPDDLLAGSDYASPVYGWYPTSHWQPNEVVREDHLVTLPSNRPARTIFAGMYSRDAAGGFVPLGQVALQTAGDQWVLRP